MWPDTRAEWTVQIRRPANWLLLAVGAGLTVTFAYLIPYAGYRSGSDAGPRAALGQMLPAEFAGAALGGLPVFIGALALIFGVLLAGGDYAWQTWKTLLVQQPSRMKVFTGKAGAVAGGTMVLMAILLAVSAAASLGVAALEGAELDWPPFVEVLRNLGAGWVIAFMWGMLGVALGVSLRAVALPVGIGLVWMLAVQNLITALAAPLLDWVDAAQEWLPGPAAGSLVATLGAREGTPGVAELSSGTQSLLVLVGYLVAFTLVSAGLLKRRDLA